MPNPEHEHDHGEAPKKGPGFLARLRAIKDGAAGALSNVLKTKVQPHEMTENVATHTASLERSATEKEWANCKRIIATVRGVESQADKAEMTGEEREQFEAARKEFQKLRARTLLAMNIAPAARGLQKAASSFARQIAEIQKSIADCQKLGVEIDPGAVVTIRKLQAGLGNLASIEVTQAVETATDRLRSITRQGGTDPKTFSEVPELLAELAALLQTPNGKSCLTPAFAKELFGDRGAPMDGLVLKALSTGARHATVKMPNMRSLGLHAIQQGNHAEVGKELQRHDAIRTWLSLLEDNGVTTIVPPKGMPTFVNELKSSLFAKQRDLPRQAKKITVQEGGRIFHRDETAAEIMQSQMDEALDWLIPRVAELLQEHGTDSADVQQELIEKEIARMYDMMFTTIAAAREAGVSEQTFAKWNARAHLLSAQKKGMEVTAQTKEAFAAELAKFREAIVAAQKKGGSKAQENVKDALREFETTIACQLLYRALRLADPDYNPVAASNLLTAALPSEIAYVRGHGIEAQLQTSVCFMFSIAKARELGLTLAEGNDNLAQHYLVPSHAIQTAIGKDGQGYANEALLRKANALKDFGTGLGMFEKMCREIGPEMTTQVEEAISQAVAAVRPNAKELADRVQRKDPEAVDAVMKLAGPGIQTFWDIISAYTQAKLDLLEQATIAATSSQDEALLKAKQEAEEVLNFAEHGASIHPDLVATLRQRLFVLTFQDRIRELPTIIAAEKAAE